MKGIKSFKKAKKYTKTKEMDKTLQDLKVEIEIIKKTN